MADQHPFNAHHVVPGRTDVWLTPRWLIEALGPFDLDPAAAPEPRPWPTARKHITSPDDGLSQEWSGLVWLNFPYSAPAPWLAKMAEHGNGIALAFARTETCAFFDSVWSRYSGVLFMRGRLNFCHPDGTTARYNAGAPSVLIGYGEEAMRRLAQRKVDGHLVVASAAILLTAEGKPVGTWRQVIEETMAGRTLRLRDLYVAIEGTSKVRAAKANGVEWRSKVRRTLQQHFQPVQRGVWEPA